MSLTDLVVIAVVANGAAWALWRLVHGWRTVTQLVGISVVFFAMGFVGKLSEGILPALGYGAIASVAFTLAYIVVAHRDGHEDFGRVESGNSGADVAMGPKERQFLRIRTVALLVIFTADLVAVASGIGHVLGYVPRTTVTAAIIFLVIAIVVGWITSAIFLRRVHSR